MIVGHKNQREFLRKIAESDKIPHAMLFSGQEKIGKKAVALEFTSLLLGEKFLTHPDFIFLEPSENEIQISQIRNLNWRLALKSYSARFKIALIDRAHCMNEEAQNCFLKTLEEPRGDSILILITEHPEALFPTIVSRCENFKFYPVLEAEIERYLKEEGVEEKESKRLAKISLGRPGLVMDFLANPQNVKEREQITKELATLMGSNLAARFQYAKKISQENNIREILNIWLAFFRENLISGLNEQKDRKYLNKIKNILNKIQDIIFLISTTNVNPKLAIEMIMLEL